MSEQVDPSKETPMDYLYHRMISTFQFSKTEVDKLKKSIDNDEDSK